MDITMDITWNIPEITGMVHGPIFSSNLPQIRLDLHGGMPVTTSRDQAAAFRKR